jgi:hypothetical protein
LAFPFEPRYESVGREIVTTMINNIIVDRAFNPTTNEISSISPRRLTNFYPIFVGHSNLISGTYSISRQHMCDVDLRTFGTLPSEMYYVTCSMSLNDTVKTMFGFGDLNTLVPQNLSGDNPDYSSTTTFGCSHQPQSRQSDTSDVNALTAGTHATWEFGPVIRGWKYGLCNGMPSTTHAIYRRGTYGQFRDMLEQRQYTKFYMTSNVEGIKLGITPSPIQVKFVDSFGKLTNPENTRAQNLSFEATSSLPYFDGETRNRTIVNEKSLNQTIVTLHSDALNNVNI